MPDILSTVRFRGDASQLLATYRSIAAQAGVLKAQIDQAAGRGLTSRGLFPAQSLTDVQKAGTYFRNLRTEIDAVNNVFRDTADTYVKFQDANGNWVTSFAGQWDQVRGNVQEATKATERYTNAVAAAETRAKRLRAAHSSLTQPIRDRLTQLRTGLQSDVAAGLITPRDMGQILAREKRTLFDYNSNLAQIKQTAREYHTALADLARVRATGPAAIRAAQYGALPTPPSIQKLERESPQLLSQLRRQGLAQTSAELFKQDVRIDFSRDAVTGVTKVRGEFQELDKVTRALTGTTAHFNAEIDKNGQSVTRFGRNMSGINGLLRQTIANFQKVIQWTIATTAVFGGLAIAAAELGVIVNIDKTLKQLGVTAQLTSQETRGLFEDIANIAYQTATPLQELLKSTDDIALAVRETGQSTEEYRGKILDLAEAVGIYTNLTGQDTVKATDTLVATMKQLNLETTDLIGLLSKITAVSGGQSNAIADVSVGLGVMAEAARQAGLDIDETIATVQVLSQVTSKSPAEVATAFKNLVGALDSRAGTKALKEFGISLRDEAGNLRNILDIYGEIADKIRQGIIPEAEVKGLVKAIAGGPRRAPDAAALLSAIEDIEQVRARSETATNEAVIANAKIIDTISARLTKLKVQFDKFVFNKFGDGLKGAVDGLISPIESLLDLLNKLDTGFISVAIQIGALMLAIRVGAAGFGFFKNQVLGLTFTMAGLAASYRDAAAAATTYNIASKGGIGQGIATGVSALGGAKGLAALGIGAAAGAGISLATGGNPLAGILTGAGTAALVAPIPLPWLKLAGAVSLAAGTILEFATNNDEAGESAEESAQEIEKLLNAFNRYKEAVDTIQRGTTVQKELGDAIRERQSIEKKTAEDLSALNDLQKQYVTNTLEMVEANKQLKESLDAIALIDPQLALDAAAAQRGEFSQEELQKKIDEYTLAFLRKTDVGATIEDVQIPEIPNIPAAPRKGDTEIRFATPGADPISSILGIDGPTSSSFNIEAIQADANKVKEIFNDTFTAIDADIPKTGDALDAISVAIAELALKGDSAAPAMKRLFDNFLIGADSIRGADVILEKFQQKLTITSLLDPKGGAELQKILDLIKEIISTAQEQGDTKTIFDTLTGFGAIVEGNAEITDEYVKGLAEKYADLHGVLDENATMEQFINEILVQRGITLDSINEAKETSVALSEEEQLAIIEAQESMDQLVKSIQASTAERSAQLSAQLAGGEFEGNEEVYERQIAQLNAISEGIAVVNASYQELASNGVGQLDSAMQNLAASFTGILGLQDAQNLSTAELIDRIFRLAETYGLTGPQVDKLTTKMNSLLGTIQLINGQKATFTIEGRVNLGPAISALRQVGASLAKIPFLSNIGGVFSAMAAALAAYQGAYYAGGISDIFKPGNTAGTSFSKIPSKSGGGGSSGSGSKTPTGGPTYDTSLIDIPDAIAQAYNRDALIQEAIKRAKALQAKIPGAAKDAKNDIVEVMLGTQRLIEVRGVKDDLLRRALEELAEIERKRLEFETKADTIRRIRVGSGDFSAIANVPLNTKTGISLGGAQGPINVSIGLTGQILTPAQMQQLADLIAASLKRQIAA